MTWGRSAQSHVRSESGTKGRSGLKTLASISPTFPIPRRPGPTAATQSLQGAEAGGAKRLRPPGRSLIPSGSLQSPGAQAPGQRANELRKR